MSDLLTDVPCDLCGTTASRMLFKTKENRSWWLEKCKDDPRLDVNFEFSVVECCGCAHAFVKPRLGARINADIYARYWRTTEPERIEASDYGNYVCRQLATFRPLGKLLDFGCGWGVQLAEAARVGWQATGVEVDQRKVDFCKEHGFDARYADVLDRPFAAETFDAVIAEQVFEHLYSPMAYMEELHRVLKPSGVLYVAVPNFGSIEARLMGNRWNMVHPVSHVRYFNRGTLAKLMNRCGFEVLRPSYIRRFGGRVQNLGHGCKVFVERNLRYYPLGLALYARRL